MDDIEDMRSRARRQTTSASPRWWQAHANELKRDVLALLDCIAVLEQQLAEARADLDRSLVEAASPGPSRDTETGA